MESCCGVVLAGGPAGLEGSSGHAVDPLFPIANRPLVVYALETLRELGVRDVALVACAANTAPLRDVVADGSRWGLQVTYVQEREWVGDGRALLAAESFAAGRPVVLHRADAICIDPLGDHLLTFHAGKLDALLLAHRVSDPTGQPMIELVRGRVAAVVQSPHESRGNLAMAGVAVLGPAVFDAVHETPPSWRGQLDLADAITRVATGGGEVRVRSIRGWWRTDGSAADLLATNRLVLSSLTEGPSPAALDGAELQGSVWLDPSAILEAAIVRGPTVIGPGVRLTDAYVGPLTSLGPGVVVDGAEIENSIVLGDATIRHVPGRLESSIIGAGARVERDFRLPRTMRVLVADRAEIALT